MFASAYFFIYLKLSFSVSAIGLFKSLKNLYIGMFIALIALIFETLSLSAFSLSNANEILLALTFLLKFNFYSTFVYKLNFLELNTF